MTMLPARRKAWRVVYGGDDPIEVVPVDDLVGHDDGDDCVCGPRVEPVDAGDGRIVWMHVHHALDGRD